MACSLSFQYSCRQFADGTACSSHCLLDEFSSFLLCICFPCNCVWLKMGALPSGHLNRKQDDKSQDFGVPYSQTKPKAKNLQHANKLHNLKCFHSEQSLGMSNNHQQKQTAANAKYSKPWSKPWIRWYGPSNMMTHMRFSVTLGVFTAKGRHPRSLPAETGTPRSSIWMAKTMTEALNFWVALLKPY